MTLDVKLVESEKEAPLDLTELSEEDQMREDIKNLRPAYRPLVYNLAYFVNDNPVLKAFVQMGVPIRQWDKDRKIAELVLRLNMDRDVKPVLIFMHDLGIVDEGLTRVIAKNPEVFAQDLNNLNARIAYLKSKKFDDESIAKILTTAPLWFNLSVTDVDTKLGWLQSEFGLTGNELRQIVTEKPKLVTLPLQIPAKIKFSLKNFLDYNAEDIKRLLIRFPKLFTKEFSVIEANFVYLTRVVKLTHDEIASYPPILQVPLHLLKSRYAYLKFLDRVQFDPTKPNFISLKKLIEPEDAVFCEKSAKTSLNEYMKFLKSV